MELLRKHIFIWTLTMFTIFQGGVLFAQTTLIPHPDSRLWIEGRSNVNQFTCHANEYRSEALVKQNNAQPLREKGATEEVVSIWVNISVDGLDCGKNKMNRDLRNALEAEDHPHITFVFIQAKTIKEPHENGGSYLIEATGDLTVSGTTRTIQFQTEGRYTENGQMQAEGHTFINMTDYNVEPPSGLFGLIKAKDELAIYFKVIAMKKITGCTHAEKRN